MTNERMSAAELRYLSERATAGPWYFTGNDRVKSESETWPEGDDIDVASTSDPLDIVSARQHADAALIVAAVNHVRNMFAASEEQAR